MNRCTVCDKTDEDDPKAAITIQGSELHCLECRKTIAGNLEDISINDVDFEFEYVSIEQDDHWLTPSVSQQDVSEQ